MRRFRLLLFLGFFCTLLTGGDPASCQSRSTDLKPYVDFLRLRNTPAKEYILSLFDKHDIVIICERDHRDSTQYDLYLSLLSDERFAKNVRNVFMEIGVSTLNPVMNAFLHATELSEDSAESAVRYFHRNCSFYPLWEKANYSDFIRGVWQINQRLPANLKLNLYPSDVPFDWQGMDTTKYRSFWKTIGARDSIMAAQIISTVGTFAQARDLPKKALVIMNFRHAFGHRFEFPPGRKPNNVGRFLFDAYGDRVANVYVNFLSWKADSASKDLKLVAIQNGKWDAALRISGKQDVGFDFAGSPFGEDGLDIWPYQTPFRFNEVFTGFVYYLPPERWRAVSGVQGLVDTTFAQEVLRRQTIFNIATGGSGGFTSIGEVIRYYSTRRSSEEDDIELIKAAVQQWLQ